MSVQPRILAFAGSARKASYNKLLVKVAARGAAAAGADVTVADLRDYPLPIYDGDLEAEQGIPSNAIELREMILAHHGLLIATPEYNSSISPLLKNTIDWVSRPVNGEDGLAPFKNKVAVLMSASPGGFGGLRGLKEVRSIFGNIGVMVLPDQLAVGKAHEAFTADGGMTNPKQQASVEALGATLACVLGRLIGHYERDADEERRHDLARIV